MYILSFNTSSSKASVAISNKDQILFAKKSHIDNAQSETLLLMIENALSKTNLKYIDLNYISVCQGPGSFTGIRIGISTAKALDMVLKKISKNYIQTLSISNFELINFKINEQFTKIDKTAILIDALRGELYTQIFENNSLESDIKILKYNNVDEFLDNLEKNTILSGSGLSKIIDNLPQNITILPRFPHPDARILCKVAYQKIFNKYILNEKIEPLYIREPDAKIPK